MSDEVDDSQENSKEIEPRANSFRSSSKVFSKNTYVELHQIAKQVIDEICNFESNNKNEETKSLPISSEQANYFIFVFSDEFLHNL